MPRSGLKCFLTNRKLKRTQFAFIAVIILVFSCRSGKEKIGYKLVSSTTKVVPDRPFEFDSIPPRFSMAKGESESLQIILDPLDTSREQVEVYASQLSNGEQKYEGLIDVRLVGYVETVDQNRWDWQKPEDIGWWPDPLLPNRPFSIPKKWTQSIWVTIEAPVNIEAGQYQFEITITSNDQSVDILFSVDIWDYAISQGQMHNMAWMPPEILGKYYSHDNMFSDEFISLYKHWADFAFDHGLPPAADMLCGWKDEDISWPIRKVNGKLDFTRFDELLEFGLERGMKEFVLAIFPRRKSFNSLDENQKRMMQEYLSTTYQHLSEKGVEDRAMVYNIDEPPESLFESCKQNYNYIKSIIPECKVYQCLNNVEGIEALKGYADIWDVYIPQYAKTGLMGSGEEIRWAVCVWPHDSPNLFTEYDGLDPRIIGWLMHKYKIKGFEYWNYFHSWKENMPFEWLPQESVTTTHWKKGKYVEGDGLLVYPGPEGLPLSSIRLENLRDGFEDYRLLAAVENRINMESAQNLVSQIVYDLDQWETSPMKIKEIRNEIKDLLQTHVK